MMAGLVAGERRGTWHYYRVVPDALVALAGVIAPAACAFPDPCSSTFSGVRC
jgi:hypothetical protein